MAVTPVGLEKDGVDLFGVDGFGLVPYGFDHGADAEVFDGSQDAFAAADDEVDGGFGVSVMREANVVELALDEVGEGVRTEPFNGGRVGDASADVVVDAKPQSGVEGGLAEEDEVVVLGKVF